MLVDIDPPIKELRGDLRKIEPVPVGYLDIGCDVQAFKVIFFCVFIARFARNCAIRRFALEGFRS
jgi:hypothetical protein